MDLTVYDSLIESAARHVFFFFSSFFVVCNMGTGILELEKIEEESEEVRLELRSSNRQAVSSKSIWTVRELKSEVRK